MRKPEPTVAIDCFVDAVERHRDCDAIVVVDVFRATTTLATALESRLTCHVVASVQAARDMAVTMDDDVLLVGEVSGSVPGDFDHSNSPVSMEHLGGVGATMILASSSGTPLLVAAAATGVPTYAACLRNVTAHVQMLSRRFSRIAVLGAGTRGEFRLEDQLGCARIANGFAGLGYHFADEATQVVAARWADATSDAVLLSPSATFLLTHGHEDDLDFVLTHEDDLDFSVVIRGTQAVAELAATYSGNVPSEAS